MRTLVNTAFTPKSVEILRPRVRQLIRELVEPLRGRDDADFLAQFAFNLPVIVMAEFLGVPSEARHEVREWSDDLAGGIFVRGNDAERMQRGEKGRRGLVDFLPPIRRAG